MESKKRKDTESVLDSAMNNHEQDGSVPARSLCAPTLCNEFAPIENGANDPRVCCVCLRTKKAFVTEIASSVFQTHRRVYCKRCYTARINTRAPLSERELNEYKVINTIRWESNDEMIEDIKKSFKVFLACWECGTDIKIAEPFLSNLCGGAVPRPFVTKASDRLFCRLCTVKYLIGEEHCGMCKQHTMETTVVCPTEVRLCKGCIFDVVTNSAKHFNLQYAQKATRRFTATPPMRDGFVAPLGDLTPESEDDNAERGDQY